eukprot:s5095_g3.t1
MRRVAPYHVNSPPFLIKDEMENSGVDLDDIYEVALSCRAEATPLAEVLKRGLAAFWARFPEEVFSAVAFLVHTALRIDDASAAEAFVDSAPGIREEADVEDLAFVVLCLLVFWLVARDSSTQDDTIDAASTGLTQLTGLPLEETWRDLLLVEANGGRLKRSAMAEMEKDDEEEKAKDEKPKDEEVQEEEEPDVSAFRPGDSAWASSLDRTAGARADRVITIRRRMQKARKEQMEQAAMERRSRTPSPMGRHKLRSFASSGRPDLEDAAIEAFEAAAARRVEVADSKQRPRKVERFHQDLIRKEVWRQKFDYIFKQMQAGVEIELQKDRKSRRPSILQQKGKEEAEDAEARRQKAVAGLSQSEIMEQELQQLRRASAPGSPLAIARVAGKLMSLKTETDQSEPALASSDEEEDWPPSPACDLPVIAPAPKLPPAGWRRTGPQKPRPAAAPPPPKHSPPPPAAEPTRSGGARRGRAGIGGLLRPSASLPALRPPAALLGVRDEYYEGDDLFMHEDILHTSNPKLFPLREGHSRPFPMLQLADAIAASEGRQRFLRAALDGVVVPLLTDTLICLSSKDPLIALPLLPALQASALWTDAFHSAAASTVNLSDLEWFLLLYVKHNLWKEAWREASKELRASEAPKLSHFGAAVRPGPGVGHAAEAEKATLEMAAAREALFDWARDRLGKERPLLEPLPATQTVLQDSHWNGLRKSMAWRVLLPLLDCLESESDFQGAMEELLVAVDDSPWMLKTLDPQHAQALLSRVARIPMSYEPVPAVAGRRAKMASMSFKVPLCSRIIPEEECNLAMVDGELKVDEANLDLSPPAFTGCKHPMLGNEELKPGAAKKVKAWLSEISVLFFRGLADYFGASAGSMGPIGAHGPSG